VEGEKIISEIKNLNSEKFFNMYYIELDTDHDEKMAQERLRGQTDLASSMKFNKMSDQEIKS
jgi:hypothetical protein